MAIEPKPRERRRFFRVEVDIPATLFLLASDDMRRTCRIFNLSGSGCALLLPSLEPISEEATHQVRFELPNKSDALYFDCQLVRGTVTPEEDG
ncbi:MAG: PilZ domain-containing protein, partial [Chloroflexota bacterium]|nr:PilZ domain-containing protein [Chloroflexota bacterium]